MTQRTLSNAAEPEVPSPDPAELPPPAQWSPSDRLDAQPLSLAGLSLHQRYRIVVFSVPDEAGAETVVCRFGHDNWPYGSTLEAKNLAASHHVLRFPRELPQGLMQDVKAVLYAAMKQGRQGRNVWSPRTADSILKCGLVTLRELARRGIANFSEVTAALLQEIAVEMLKAATPEAVGRRMQIIQLVWEFPDEVMHSLPECPWGARRFSRTRMFAKGRAHPDASASAVGKTPVIPREVQRAVFECAEHLTSEAELDLRSMQPDGPQEWSTLSIELRDAVLFLLQITSGMRNSESTGVQSDSWRKEEKLGTSLHWVKTRLIKGSIREVEFLVPPETVHALELLQAYVRPLQQRLEDEADWLRAVLREQVDAQRPFRKSLSSGLTRVATIARLKHIGEIRSHLFLGLNNSSGDHLKDGYRVDVLSNLACNKALRRMVARAGADWKIANHQCRRTFAYNVANSRLGRHALVFLKWQLKHVSLAWTQLYASNPFQDLSLYDDLKREQIQARSQLMEGWMDSDAPLTGGAGRKLMVTRAVPAKDLKQLLLKTAEAIDLRSTGHAWCMAGTSVCEGQGVYDPNSCPGCSESIIDGSQGPTWQLIHLDNLRLAAIQDCGVAVIKRAKRSVETSAQVLRDLGVALPTPVPADADDRQVMA